MQLLLLLLALLAPRPALTWMGRRFPSVRITEQAKGRVGLSLFFGVTSLGHFLKTAPMMEMLPPVVPFRRTLIYFTGVLEALGAVGLWIPRLRRLIGLGLLLMVIGLLPANIYAAFKRVEFGGHALGPAYLLVRVPFQALVVWRLYKDAVEAPAE